MLNMLKRIYAAFSTSLLSIALSCCLCLQGALVDSGAYAYDFHAACLAPRTMFHHDRSLVDNCLSVIFKDMINDFDGCYKVLNKMPLGELLEWTLLVIDYQNRGFTPSWFMQKKTLVLPSALVTLRHAFYREYVEQLDADAQQKNKETIQGLTSEEYSKAFRKTKKDYMKLGYTEEEAEQFLADQEKYIEQYIKNRAAEAQHTILEIPADFVSLRAIARTVLKTGLAQARAAQGTNYLSFMTNEEMQAYINAYKASHRKSKKARVSNGGHAEIPVSTISDEKRFDAEAVDQLKEYCSIIRVLLAQVQQVAAVSYWKKIGLVLISILNMCGIPFLNDYSYRDKSFWKKHLTQYNQENTERILAGMLIAGILQLEDGAWYVLPFKESLEGYKRVLESLLKKCESLLEKNKITVSMPQEYVSEPAQKLEERKETDIPSDNEQAATIQEVKESPDQHDVPPAVQSDVLAQEEEIDAADVYDALRLYYGDISRGQGILFFSSKLSDYATLFNAYHITPACQQKFFDIHYALIIPLIHKHAHQSSREQLVNIGKAALRAIQQQDLDHVKRRLANIQRINERIQKTPSRQERTGLFLAHILPIVLLTVNVQEKDPQIIEAAREGAAFVNKDFQKLVDPLLNAVYSLTPLHTGDSIQSLDAVAALVINLNNQYLRKDDVNHLLSLLTLQENGTFAITAHKIIRRYTATFDETGKGIDGYVVRNMTAGLSQSELGHSIPGQEYVVCFENLIEDQARAVYQTLTVSERSEQELGTIRRSLSSLRAVSRYGNAVPLSSSQVDDLINVLFSDQDMVAIDQRLIPIIQGTDFIPQAQQQVLDMARAAGREIRRKRINKKLWQQACPSCKATLEDFISIAEGLETETMRHEYEHKRREYMLQVNGEILFTAEEECAAFLAALADTEYPYYVMSQLLEYLCASNSSSPYYQASEQIVLFWINAFLSEQERYEFRALQAQPRRYSAEAKSYYYMKFFTIMTDKMAQGSLSLNNIKDAAREQQRSIHQSLLAVLSETQASLERMCGVSQVKVPFETIKNAATSVYTECRQYVAEYRKTLAHDLSALTEILKSLGNHVNWYDSQLLRMVLSQIPHLLPRDLYGKIQQTLASRDISTVDSIAALIDNQMNNSQEYSSLIPQLLQVLQSTGSPLLSTLHQRIARQLNASSRTEKHPFDPAVRLLLQRRTALEPIYKKSSTELCHAVSRGTSNVKKQAAQQPVPDTHPSLYTIDIQEPHISCAA